MAGRVLPPQDTGGPSSKSLLLTRLTVAVLGAAALYWLTGAAVAPPSWPATAPALFAPMLLAAIYLPLLAMLGCGKMPVLPLAVWLVCAAITIAGLGYHDVARGRIAGRAGQPLSAGNRIAADGHASELTPLEQNEERRDD